MGQRIYVAGRFRRYEECRALMDDLVAVGHTITHDWTRTEEFGDDGHPKATDGDLDRYAQRCHAVDDLRGVRTADMLVVLAHDSLCGGLIEVGAALAYGVPVWICDPWRHTIFWHHPLITVTDEPSMRESLGVLVKQEA